MYSIGIDIGGTQLRCAVFAQDHSIVDRIQMPNDRSLSAEANTDRLIDFIKSRDYPYAGIGIGCPGPLDFTAGCLLNPPNLYGWNDFNIVKYFEKKSGLRTILNNDANAAGLAEALLGAGKGKQSVFYITVSTGIGGAYVYKGELVNGAHSVAAEAYDLMVCEDGYCHNGANPGSLNEMCGGHALARQAEAAFGYPVDVKDLYDRLYLAEHNSKAEQIVERCIDNLARGIGNIACIVDPDIFIFGGSIALRSPGFLEKVEERARRYMIRPEYLCMERAKLGDDAGLIGASLLVPPV
ncbi:ROK family protein [Treponema primitia]|uniref:ROK family protein n=1 Tax=Treponema primitia TaxID=88058 RepID=UPI00397EC5E7